MENPATRPDHQKLYLVGHAMVEPYLNGLEQIIELALVTGEE